MRAIRSLLYAPGNRERIIAKAPEAGADAVMFDLADSVPVAEKDRARGLVAAAITALAGRNLYVKLNESDSGRLAEDVDAVTISGLSGVLLPQVSTPETVRELDRLIGDRERARGLPVGRIEILLLLETAEAILLAYELAVALPRVASIFCGTAEGGDLARSLGSTWTPGGRELIGLRSRIILAARAAGLSWPIDGVFASLDDPAGLEAEAELARRLGFRGKLAIHPKQVATINRIFTPSDREIAWSRRVLAAEEAVAGGDGTGLIDGVMVGPPAVTQARALLALAEDYAR